MKFKHIDIDNSSIKSGRLNRKITETMFNNFVSSIAEQQTNNIKQFFVEKEQEKLIHDGILGYDTNEKYIFYKFGTKRISQKPLMSSSKVNNYYNLFLPDLYFIYFYGNNELFILSNPKVTVPLTNLFSTNAIKHLRVSDISKQKIMELSECKQGNFFCLGASLKYILPEITKSTSSAQKKFECISNNMELIINTVLSSKGNGDLSLYDSRFRDLVSTIRSRNDCTYLRGLHIALQLYSTLSKDFETYEDVYKNVYSKSSRTLLDKYFQDS